MVRSGSRGSLPNQYSQDHGLRNYSLVSRFGRLRGQGQMRINGVSGFSAAFSGYAHELTNSFLPQPPRLASAAGEEDVPLN
jgi:hypothetical protein